MPRATSEKINQRVIANKQIEKIRWKSKTYPVYLKENGKVRRGRGEDTADGTNRNKQQGGRFKLS